MDSQEHLTAKALRVSVTSTGKQMAALVDDEPADLVVLDPRLAAEDGMAIARTLRDRLRAALLASRQRSRSSS